jgi:CheY-like chemotaxis protein
MPKLTGYELAREIRANEATSRIPVILLTARVQEDPASSAELPLVCARTTVDSMLRHARR